MLCIRGMGSIWFDHTWVLTILPKDGHPSGFLPQLCKSNCIPDPAAKVKIASGRHNQPLEASWLRASSLKSHPGVCHMGYNYRRTVGPPWLSSQAAMHLWKAVAATSWLNIRKVLAH